MKAAVFTQYGSPDVIHTQEIPTPTPKDNEIRIRIRANAVNFGDILVRKFNTISPAKFSMPMPLWLPARLVLGWNKPRNPIMGSEYAGDVDAVGKNVTRFKVGDAVFGYRGMVMGANAEYLCVAEEFLSVVHKPAAISYEEVATIPGGALTALSLLRKVNIQPGQKVLINGASGGIGSAAVQLAKYYGAEVTGVCGTPRMEYVKALGADQVIDYTKEDFTSSGATYDLIIDIQGKLPFSRAKRALKPDGKLLYVSFKMTHVFQMLWTSIGSGKKVICALSGETTEDLLFIKELIEAGHIKSVVDRCFPLEQAAEAHWYMEGGQKRGNVVLTMQPQN